MNTQEKAMVSKMIHIYCRSRHGQKESLCPVCRQMEAYAHQQLENCPFGEKKPMCKYCTIHCYKPEYRKRIREIMRYSGPRMLLYHPLYSIKHMFRKK